MSEQAPNFCLISNSESETLAIGTLIGQRLIAGMVIALSGTLGAGKTRLVQAIARGLDVESDTVTSPTFTICIPYAGRLPMWHLDAYRIKSVDEVDELGLDEQIDFGSIVLVEWAERIEEALPPIDVWLRLKLLDDQVRSISVTSESEKGADLLRGLADSGLEKWQK
ncbi:MAG: tRNA (adenosine(37)-N6)-threonylcarbamoyltransferase complex ATPase subunit type 1 TsaE [Planctomycetota bacterium]